MSFHAPWFCFRLSTGFKLWQLAQRSSTSFLPSPSGNSCGTAVDRGERATVRVSEIAVLLNMRDSIIAMKRTVCCICRVQRAPRREPDGSHKLPEARRGGCAQSEPGVVARWKREDADAPGSSHFSKIDGFVTSIREHNTLTLLENERRLSTSLQFSRRAPFMIGFNTCTYASYT